MIISLKHKANKNEKRIIIILKKKPQITYDKINCHGLMPRIFYIIIFKKEKKNICNKQSSSSS